MNSFSSPLISRVAALALLVIAGTVMPAAAQQSVDLDFSNPTTSSNGSDSLGTYWNSSVLSFTNVGSLNGTNIDLRVTATAWGSFSFTRQYADYSNAVSQPNGDLGFMYTSTGNGSGGLHYQLEFFESGSNYTTAIVIPEVKLLIYDVDGEPAQSEKLRVYDADGLFAYQTGTAVSSVTDAPFAGGVLFTGPGSNYSETDPTGAVILTYRYTDSILLDFESTTFSGGSGNGVFSAVDGDLSMLNGDTSGFENPQVVPEPSGALLLCITGMLVIFRRRGRDNK